MTLPAVGTEVRYPADVPSRRQRRGWVASYTGRSEAPLEIGLYTEQGRQDTVLAAPGEIAPLKIRRVPRGFQAVDLETEPDGVFVSLRLRDADVQVLEQLAAWQDKPFDQMFADVLRDVVEQADRRLGRTSRQSA